jgi:glyceraldehyde-3-phosphate dehydrogenase/erythrose-4-phosphate dehydrogenase
MTSFPPTTLQPCQIHRHRHERKIRPALGEHDTLVVGGQRIKCLAVREGPAALPWKEVGVEIVIECTGLFTDAAKARGHLEAGAKKVITSAPAKGEEITVVMGVNSHQYDRTIHHFVSRPVDLRFDGLISALVLPCRPATSLTGVRKHR